MEKRRRACVGDNRSTERCGFGMCATLLGVGSNPFFTRSRGDHGGELVAPSASPLESSPLTDDEDEAPDDGVFLEAAEVAKH